jgi:hypothetical protein
MPTFNFFNANALESFNLGNFLLLNQKVMKICERNPKRIFLSMISITSANFSSLAFS